MSVRRTGAFLGSHHPSRRLQGEYDDDDDVDDENASVGLPGPLFPPRLSHEGLSGVYRTWLGDIEVSTIVYVNIATISVKETKKKG